MWFVPLLALTFVNAASSRQIFVPTLNDTDCAGRECPENTYCVRPLEWTMPQFCVPIGVDMNAPYWPRASSPHAEFPDVLFAAIIFTATAMGLVAVIQVIKFAAWLRRFM